MYLHCVHKITFYIEIGHFLETLDSTTFEAKMPYYAK